MNILMKSAAVAGLAGLMAVGAVAQSEARPRGNAAAAAGIGFAAGALVGAAAASNYNRGGGYYGGGYAYAPGPVYYDERPAYGYGGGYESYGSYYEEPQYYAPRRGNTRQRQNGAYGTGTSD